MLLALTTLTLLCVQIRTRAVSAKQMTMVTPLQLLIYSSSQVAAQGDMVKVDDWCVLRLRVLRCPLASMASGGVDELAFLDRFLHHFHVVKLSWQPK